MTECPNGGLSQCAAFTNPAPHSETQVDHTVSPMTAMRAKMKIHFVDKRHEGQETLTFHAVCASQYPADGSDENNTFAKFTPSATLQMVVTNPALLDTFSQGEEYYLDFTLSSVAD